MTASSTRSNLLAGKAILAACVGASLGAAQAINIRGTVKDRTGAGVSGATVALESANISTTSRADGSFVLTGPLAGIRGRNRVDSPAECPVSFQKGRLEIVLPESAPVAITVHEAGGRKILSSNGIYGAGTHLLPFPAKLAGIHWHTIAVGSHEFTFQSSRVEGAPGEIPSGSGRSGAGSLSKQVRARGEFRDVLSIRKVGLVDHRDSIRTPDTSGIMVRMLPNAGNMTDADGNVYQSVSIGDQVWTVGNLKTTRYNDGTPIPHVIDNLEWNALVTGAYCFYDNEPANKDKFGAMYHWYAVRTGKLAPTGWHVPTDEEWEKLKSYLMANGYNSDGTTTTNRVAKSLAAKTDWAPSALAGSVGNDPGNNNATGFSALPGGGRHDAGPIEDRFISKDSAGFFWSATPEAGADTTRAWLFSLYNNRTGLVRSVHYKKYALSVRLLRDD